MEEANYICGRCGKEDPDHLEKVVCGQYTNHLCLQCRIEFAAELNEIAREFLGP